MVFIPFNIIIPTQRIEFMEDKTQRNLELIKKERATTKRNRSVTSLSGQEDSNFRPPRPERGALPTALYPEMRCKNTLLL